MLFMIEEINRVIKKKPRYTNTCILKNSDINFHSHTLLQQRHTNIYSHCKDVEECLNLADTL